VDLKDHPKVKEGQENFTKVMYSKVLFQCKHCKEASFSKKPGKKDPSQCMTCEQQRNKDIWVWKFKGTQQHGPNPPEKCHITLALNKIEEMLVAKAYPYMKIHRLKNGQTAHQGGCLNVEKEVMALFNSLSIRPANIPVSIVQMQGKGPALKDFLE
jgi:hypothetical protein